jgi:hypothetical protein
VNYHEGYRFTTAAALRWKPKTTFHDLVHDMLEHDLKLEGVDPAQHLHQQRSGEPPD